MIFMVGQIHMLKPVVTAPYMNHSSFNQKLVSMLYDNITDAGCQDDVVKANSYGIHVLLLYHHIHE